MPNIQVTRAEFESYWVNRRRRKRRLDTLQNLLFGHGENGFLFGNFGELDELFTTSAGTLAVAANDDTVGLALDDSAWGGKALAQIIAAAAELVTNGQFGTDPTGWTANGSTLAAVAGQLEITSTGAGFAARALYSFATVVGMTYRLALDSLTVGNAIRVGTTSAGVDVVPNTGIGLVSGYSIYFVAASTTTHVGLIGSAVLGGKNYFDNVSIKLVPGNHALQATAANRPLWKANAGKPYLLFDGSNDALIPPFYPNAASGLSVAVAFNNTTGAVDSAVIGGGTSTNNKRFLIGLDTTGRLLIAWGTQVAWSTLTDLRNANHIVVVTGDVTGRNVWLDGVDITSGFAAATDTPDGTGGALALAGRQATVGGVPTLPMAGKIPAALALNRRVTPAEIARITADFQSTF